VKLPWSFGKLDNGGDRTIGPAEPRLGGRDAIHRRADREDRGAGTRTEGAEAKRTDACGGKRCPGCIKFDDGEVEPLQRRVGNRADSNGFAAGRSVDKVLEREDTSRRDLDIGRDFIAQRAKDAVAVGQNVDRTAGGSAGLHEKCGACRVDSQSANAGK